MKIIKTILSMILLSVLVIWVHAATIYQDNWESNMVAHWAFKSTSAGCSIYTSDDCAHSGTYSLKSIIDTASDIACIYDQTHADALSECYIRSWVYVPSATLDEWDSGEFAGFTRLTDIGDDDIACLAIYNDGSNVIFHLDYNEGNYIVDSGNQIAADTWYCVEAYIKLDPSSGVAKLWVNGRLVDTVTGDTNSNLASGVKYIGVGFDETGGITGTIYIDDFIIDTSRYIGTGWRVQEGGAVGSHYQY